MTPLRRSAPSTSAIADTVRTGPNQATAQAAEPSDDDVRRTVAETAAALNDAIRVALRRGLPVELAIGEGLDAALRDPVPQVRAAVSNALEIPDA